MQRCPWCEGFELYHTYHDTEWGVPLRDKRDSCRIAFDHFDPEKIARYDEAKVAEHLLRLHTGLRHGE